MYVFRCWPKYVWKSLWQSSPSSIEQARLWISRGFKTNQRTSIINSSIVQAMFSLWIYVPMSRVPWCILSHAFRCRRTTLTEAMSRYRACTSISRRRRTKNASMPWNFWLIRTSGAATSCWRTSRRRPEGTGTARRTLWRRLCSWKRKWIRCVCVCMCAWTHAREIDSVGNSVAKK